MKNLIESILNKDLISARESFRKSILTIVESKLAEKKKMVASSITEKISIKEAEESEGNKFIAYYMHPSGKKVQPIEVYGKSSYEAHRNAMSKFKAKKPNHVHVYLADKPINTASLGEERIDEVSNKLLRNYISKALDDVSFNNYKSGVARAVGYDEKSEKHTAKAGRRTVHIRKAVNKLAK